MTTHFRSTTYQFTICAPDEHARDDQHTPACQMGRLFAREAIEWRGAGLGIWRDVPPAHDLHEEYALIHLASGRALSERRTRPHTSGGRLLDGRVWDEMPPEVPAAAPAVGVLPSWGADSTIETARRRNT